MKGLMYDVLLVAGVFFLMVGLVSIPMYCQAEEDAAHEEEAPGIEPICPFTHIGDESSCLDCHKVTKNDDGYEWAVRDDTWQDPPFGVEILEGNVAYYLLDQVNAAKFFELYEYCVDHGIKKIHLEIQSPGGSVVEAWRIIGLMQKYRQNYGIETTTECLGFAASAGAIILISGDYRVASPRAMLMLHELWSLSFIKLATPSKTQDDARNMEIWQSNINDWLAEKSGMTADEIAELIKHKDWWLTGQESFEKGFVDKLIWENAVVAEADCE